MKRLLPLILLVLFLCFPAQVCAWDETGSGFDPDNYKFRYDFDVEADYFDSTLTSFPVLLWIDPNATDSDPATKLDAGIDDGTCSDASKIVFASNADPQVKLKHEIRSYNNGTGELIVWLQLDSVSHSADTTYWLYYGFQGTCTGTTEDSEGVWTMDQDSDSRNDYVFVSHMENASSTIVVDESPYGNDGNTYTGSPNSISTCPSDAFEDCMNYSGTSEAHHIDAAAADADMAYNTCDEGTLQAWAYGTTATANQSIVDLRGDGNDRIILRQLNATTVVTHNHINNYRNVPMATTNNTWHSYTSTWDFGATSSIWVDGSETVDGQTGGTAFSTVPNDGSIGANEWGTTEEFYGRIDEVRILNYLLPDDWIESEYDNHTKPGPDDLFFLWGSEEAGVVAEICDAEGDEDGNGCWDCEDSACEGETGPNGETCGDENNDAKCKDGYNNNPSRGGCTGEDAVTGADTDTDCADSSCDGYDGNEAGDHCEGTEGEDETGTDTCGDDFDNDAKNGTDCADPACDGIDNDDESITCNNPEDTLCDDGEDNDANGDTDCEDVNCDGVDGEPGPGTAVCESDPATETLCDDEFDNDASGSADCLDPDCDGEDGNPSGTDLCEYDEELTCDDLFDNDADGDTDVVDSECHINSYFYDADHNHSHADWTATGDWEDDVFKDSGTDESVYSTTNNAAIWWDYVGIDTALESAGVDEIFALRYWIRASRVSDDYRHLRLATQVDADTIIHQTVFAVGDSAGYYYTQQEENPHTETAWVTSDFDDIRIGIATADPGSFDAFDGGGKIYEQFIEIIGSSGSGFAFCTHSVRFGGVKSDQIKVWTRTNATAEVRIAYGEDESDVYDSGDPDSPEVGVTVTDPGYDNAIAENDFTVIETIPDLDPNTPYFFNVYVDDASVYTFEYGGAARSFWNTLPTCLTMPTDTGFFVSDILTSGDKHEKAFDYQVYYNALTIADDIKLYVCLGDENILGSDQREINDYPGDGPYWGNFSGHWDGYKARRGFALPNTHFGDSIERSLPIERIWSDHDYNRDNSGKMGKSSNSTVQDGAPPRHQDWNNKYKGLKIDLDKAHIDYSDQSIIRLTSDQDTDAPYPIVPAITSDNVVIRISNSQNGNDGYYLASLMQSDLDENGWDVIFRLDDVGETEAFANDEWHIDKIPFNNGDNEPTIGDIIEEFGITDISEGLLRHYIVTSGSWGGTAAGFLYLESADDGTNWDEDNPIRNKTQGDEAVGDCDMASSKTEEDEVRRIGDYAGVKLEVYHWRTWNALAGFKDYNPSYDYVFPGDAEGTATGGDENTLVSDTMTEWQFDYESGTGTIPEVGDAITVDGDDGDIVYIDGSVEAGTMIVVFDVAETVLGDDVLGVADWDNAIVDDGEQLGFPIESKYGIYPGMPIFHFSGSEDLDDPAFGFVNSVSGTSVELASNLVLSDSELFEDTDRYYIKRSTLARKFNIGKIDFFIIDMRYKSGTMDFETQGVDGHDWLDGSRQGVNPKADDTADGYVANRLVHDTVDFASTHGVVQGDIACNAEMWTFSTVASDDPNAEIKDAGTVSVDDTVYWPESGANEGVVIVDTDIAPTTDHRGDPQITILVKHGDTPPKAGDRVYVDASNYVMCAGGLRYECGVIESFPETDELLIVSSWEEILQGSPNYIDLFPDGVSDYLIFESGGSEHGSKFANELAGHQQREWLIDAVNNSVAQWQIIICETPVYGVYTDQNANQFNLLPTIDPLDCLRQYMIYNMDYDNLFWFGADQHFGALSDGKTGDINFVAANFSPLFGRYANIHHTPGHDSWFVGGKYAGWGGQAEHQAYSSSFVEASMGLLEIKSPSAMVVSLYDTTGTILSNDQEFDDCSGFDANGDGVENITGCDVGSWEDNELIGYVAFFPLYNKQYVITDNGSDWVTCDSSLGVLDSTGWTGAIEIRARMWTQEDVTSFEYLGPMTMTLTESSYNLIDEDWGDDKVPPAPGQEEFWDDVISMFLRIQGEM